MGLSGLALAWRLVSKFFGVDVAISEGIGLLAIATFLTLTVAYAVKWVKYPQVTRAEFLHPVSGNFFGTITIALLLLSAVVSSYSVLLQEIVWSIGTLLTIALSFIIISRFLKGQLASSSAVPAWLIPGAASLDIAAAGSTLPVSWAHEFNFFGAGVGSVLATVFFVLIFSRLIQGEPLSNAMVPSLMILIAPFEVGFLAYVNITNRVDTFAAMLFYFGLFLFFVLAIRVFRPSIPFAPSWWAISFPIAALSNAALIYANVTESGVLIVLALAILALLSIAISLLFIRTMHSLFSGKLLAG